MHFRILLLSFFTAFLSYSQEYGEKGYIKEIFLSLFSNSPQPHHTQLLQTSFSESARKSFQPVYLDYLRHLNDSNYNQSISFDTINKENANWIIDYTLYLSSENNSIIQKFRSELLLYQSESSYVISKISTKPLSQSLKIDPKTERSKKCLFRT